MLQSTNKINTLHSFMGFFCQKPATSPHLIKDAASRAPSVPGSTSTGSAIPPFRHHASFPFSLGNNGKVHASVNNANADASCSPVTRLSVTRLSVLARSLQVQAHLGVIGRWSVLCRQGLFVHQDQLTQSPTMTPRRAPQRTWVLEWPRTSLSFMSVMDWSSSRFSLVLATTAFRIWACFPAWSLTLAASYMTMAEKPRQMGKREEVTP
mmetsp:Transcript_1704/g.4365  ORF Transcript_1704/g.4365 Transcript_1704/m.4365 type:complete len:209 (+) Transcript_1704:715-1341(+)